MKVIPIESRPQLERTHNARSWTYHYHQLLEGDEKQRDNFSLQLVRTYGDLYSPRHRHNFDQVRFQLEGESSFTRDGGMKVGSVAYFPESTPYGPQKNEGDSLILLLQFGGASGNGYISERAYHAAAGEMKKTGEFKGGFYNATGQDQGKDAFEAVWEHVNGRRIAYAPQRYNTAVFMNPEAFEWASEPGMPDTLVKSLGTFSERKVEISMVRLPGEGRLAMTGHAIAFVASGKGRLGAHAVGARTTIELDQDEAGILVASTPLEALLIKLPPLTAVRVGRPAESEAVLA
ncbi:MAG: hypothetical protein EXR27_20415 [Betaproteobacteria bacterium]|nr:hypothetical protein [Betaproteobacteria bacterium]